LRWERTGRGRTRWNHGGSGARMEDAGPWPPRVSFHVSQRRSKRGPVSLQTGTRPVRLHPGTRKMGAGAETTRTSENPHSANVGQRSAKFARRLSPPGPIRPGKDHSFRRCAGGSVSPTVSPGSGRGRSVAPRGREGNNALPRLRVEQNADAPWGRVQPRVCPPGPHPGAELEGIVFRCIMPPRRLS
jgi:hypothetical protein